MLFAKLNSCLPFCVLDGASKWDVKVRGTHDINMRCFEITSQLFGSIFITKGRAIGASGDNLIETWFKRTADVLVVDHTPQYNGFVKVKYRVCPHAPLHVYFL